jgi:bifunctional non-homologous end joining protein LigD
VIGARQRALPDPANVRGARKGILPAFLEPSLPQTSAKAPSGPKWVHEIKYDGYRLRVERNGRSCSADYARRIRLDQAFSLDCRGGFKE